MKILASFVLFALFLAACEQAILNNWFTCLAFVLLAGVILVVVWSLDDWVWWDDEDDED